MSTICKSSKNKKEAIKKQHGQKESDVKAMPDPSLPLDTCIADGEPHVCGDRVIVSNGGVGYEGGKDSGRLNTTGTNHGGLACLNGQWTIFYHRNTNKTEK